MLPAAEAGPCGCRRRRGRVSSLYGRSSRSRWPAADFALPALSLYLAGYAVTNLGAFAVTAALPGRTALEDHRGLARTHPALALLVLLLGLVGTPPTAVFTGKLAVFAAALDGGLGWLVVVAALNTVASLFYYLRWLAPALDRAGQPLDGGTAVRPTARVCAIATAVASLALGGGAGLVLGLHPATG